MSGKGAGFSTDWARRPWARAVREVILVYVLKPAIGVYTHPRVVGREELERLTPPALFISNHSSHLDTPVILLSLPTRWRRRTAVVAAADYFYSNKLIGSTVSLAFGTIPIERARLSRESAERIDRLISSGWSLLFYPEGTRSRSGNMGKLRSGAAFLAVEHRVPIVPLYVRGTYEAMPPGRAWPVAHPVTVFFGTPVQATPDEDHRSLTRRLEMSLDDLNRQATEQTS
jgi:1-acyl-sn-glycerol-3-phosphate acyltransferase